ncbi:uncharacterized protein KIAA1958-like [Mytilus galloprovincialis]|uniref:uncharacterized protein KIAA1958-like n=1 Tax=Mytilus galloprovincialis TaxID=29158 RepID=UPI003F7B62EB
MVESCEKRFGNPARKEDLDKLINSQKNSNTEKITKWAVEAFMKWREQRNKENENIPLLKHMDAETMDSCLQRFVVEVRKRDGLEYPPKSLYYIICGLLRHLRDEEIHDKNFLNENDIRFAVFRKVLNAKMKELASWGLGSTTKQADPITKEDEEKIWNSGVFGCDNSVALQNTVFFYNCKLFGMRGYDDHKKLECEQFSIGCDGSESRFIHFTGRTSKTFSGRLNQLHVKSKDIKHFCPKTKDRCCIAEYYEKYLAALGNRGPFYRRPLAGSSIRYGEQAVGISKLKGFMREITSKAGLQGNFTNHSGKRSCATQLYTAGIPEQEMMSRTGHRTETAVRKYKRSSNEILPEVSDVLNPPMKREKPGNALLENDMEVDSPNKSTELLPRSPFPKPMQDISTCFPRRYRQREN